jgi:hypothetical protein
MTAMPDLGMLLMQLGGYGAGAAPDAAYRQWLQKNGLREDPTYDMRGAFAAGMQPDERGHMGDEFKLPTHPTFSDESRYSTADKPGGRWSQVGKGDRWRFDASPTNLENMNRAQLADYFDRVEPGNTIRFPDGSEYVGGSRGKK